MDTERIVAFFDHARESTSQNTFISVKKNVPIQPRRSVMTKKSIKKASYVKIHKSWRVLADGDTNGESDTRAEQTTVSLAYTAHTYENFPENKLKLKTQPRQENKLSTINEQYLHLTQRLEAAEQTPKQKPKPCKEKTEVKSHLSYSLEQKRHGGCTNDLYQMEEKTEKSAPKIKPEPSQKQQTPLIEMSDDKETSFDSIEQKQHQKWTGDLTQKVKATEMSAPLIKPQPKQRRQTPCKEVYPSDKPFSDSVEQKKHQRWTGDLTQKVKATEMSAPLIKPQPKPR